MGIISIRGPAAGVVAGIFRENLREETRRTKLKKANVWKCYLKCGHVAYRPIKRRRGSMGQDPEDPAPAWVYCELCADEEYTGRHEHA